MLVSGRPLTISRQQDTDGQQAAADPSSVHSLLMDPPSGIPPPRGVNATDAISQTLAAIPQGQLEEVLARMKVSLGVNVAQVFFVFVSRNVC